MASRFSRTLSHSCRAYHSKIPTATIPKLNRDVSRIGFGAYRVSQPRHAEALEAALKGGVSIVDMGSNFENGAAEKMVGDTLQRMKGQLDRNDVTLVSKAGYMNKADTNELEPADYVQINEKSYHGISPRLLENQLANSLFRLSTDRLDVFMINAPERMLSSKNKPYSRKQLYRDLGDSFEYLDGLVTAGVIGGYGVCSNTMALPSAVDHVSLDDIIKACKRPDNLVAIEVPFNLYEREAVVSSAVQHLSAPENTVAEIAKEHGIYLMTNRPLNSISNGHIRTLVNHDPFSSGSAEHEMMEKMTNSFQLVSELESELMSELPLEEESLVAKFVWGQVLSENLARLAQNHFATQHYLHLQVSPAVDRDLDTLKQYAIEQDESLQPAFEEWTAKYRQAINSLLKDIVSYAYIDTLRKNNELDRVLDALCPSFKKHPDAHSPLSVKAIEFLLAHPQVGTVMTGMRDSAYVKDALLAASTHAQHPLDDEDIMDVWRCPIFG
ncbi:NADP-dependent oxidoreductase domain-containing protein [Phycomyces nitens]|nr:NADP-dependent oxidoreductase domain-containing protein [Phycomyces nitens]